MFKRTFLFLMLFTASISFSQSPWKLEKNSKGIEVYTRKLEGKDFKEFKATTLVSCSMSSLVDLLEKVEEYPEWQANVASGKLLKRLNPKERFIHYTTDLPWPFDDRDIIVYCKKTVYKNGAVKYYMEARPDYMKEDEDYIRIRDGKGYWKFVPKENGQIKVIYHFYGDPAGSLPSSIVNLFIVDGPYETMENLQKIK